MFRKRKDIFNNLEDENNNDDSIARSIREIPFKFMAANNKLEENFFLKKVYQNRRYSNFYLGPNCEKKFTEAGNVLMTHSQAQVQDMVQEKESRRVRLKVQSVMPPEFAMSYSNALSLSTAPPPKEEKLPVFESLWQKKKTPDEIYRERLVNLSPSAISDDFKSYSTIEFENNEKVLASEEFGIYHCSLVELFLEQMVHDERMIVGIILNSSLQKQQRDLYKKLATFHRNDNNRNRFPELRPILKTTMLKKS